jgi:hypothetical protein
MTTSCGSTVAAPCASASSIATSGYQGAPAEALALRSVAQPHVRQLLWRAHDDLARPRLERRKHGAEALRGDVERLAPALRRRARAEERRERGRLSGQEGSVLNGLVLDVHLHEMAIHSTIRFLP